MPIQVLMPALSPTMTEGKLAKWLKKEGDVVKSGMVIAEIETDKATMEVEAVDEGILGRVLVPEGTENVKVNAPIALVGEAGEDFSTFVSTPPVDKVTKPVDPIKNVSAPTQPAPKMTPPLISGHNASSAGLAKAHKGRIIASPLARRVASIKGLDLRFIAGTGPNGRIVFNDVGRLGAGQQQAPVIQQIVAPQPTGPNARELADLLAMPYETQANSMIRKVIAKRLSESKQTVPHFYLTVDCRLDALLAVRKSVNNDGGKVSVNDLIIKAAAKALRDVPAANASWTEEAILLYKDVDISVAVATPHGLMTPIVKGADTKDVKTISTEVKDLATRARDNKLKPAEFQGGTFTISNLGMFGIKHFEAIINPPQACILAIGAGVEQPVVSEGQIVVGTVMSATLSVDHRVVDGAVGAEYLKAFKAHIESPENLVS